MAMMKGSSSTQDSVSYDQFIGMLDENLKRRSYSGETLYQAMKLYDLEGSDNILV
jgi:Ca2+-binding EF-hand superfamily protein